MKNLKKVLLAGSLTIATLMVISTNSNAATIKVTGEVVNIRKSASTESDVVARLSENVECEYLGQEGDWYKVKYNNYTGYVSKQYAKLEGEVTTSTQSNNQETNNQTDNTKINNQNTENNNTQTNNETSNQNTETNTNNENTTTDDTQGNNDETSRSNETPKLVYKKFNQNTVIRILPLIYSSNIGQAKKNDEVLILSETTGWSYIQTDEISRMG